MLEGSAVRPDFLLIGAMKCATSTVSAYLEDHPEVFVVPGAEPRFFCDDESWARGPEWYARFFEGYQGQKLAGEGSNAYADRDLNPRTAERIASFNPDMKLVYMVRDPVQRAVSNWVQNRVDSGDDVPATFAEAIEEDPGRFVNQSRYWRQYEAYRAHFPASQIFIGFVEDMKKDQQAFFDSLCDFLGVEKGHAPARPHVNPSSAKRVPSPLYTAVRSLPLFDRLKALIPAAVRDRVKSGVLSVSPAEATELSPETRARIEGLVRDDARQLLAHCGKPADFWRCAA